MIGLAIGTAVLLVLALLVGAVLLGLLALLLRRRSGLGKKLVLASAVVLPVISAGYMWLCVALLPGESLFGDIDQPLPNGYSVTALGKMPDYASIGKETPSNFKTSDVGCSVGKLAVDGKYVLGQCSHSFGDDHAMDGTYFLLDTTDGTVERSETEAPLEARLQHAAALVEVQYFQSREPRTISRRRWHRLLMQGPPVVALFALLLAAFRLRLRSTAPRSSVLLT